MGASSRRAVVVALLVVATGVAACDAIIGLDSYTNVACAFDCGVDTGVSNAESGLFDAVAVEASPVDAGDAGDAHVVEAAPPGDSGFDGPSPAEIWAHWPMPNPDAALGPESDALLPNPMSYDLGPDAGSPTTVDNVTKLTWWRVPQAVGGGDAQPPCAMLPGNGWHVPTRIELVSLVNFAVSSGAATIDTRAFPNVTSADGKYVTSSVVANEGGPPLVWLLDFSTGLVSQGSGGALTLCVQEPGP